MFRSSPPFRSTQAHLLVWALAVIVAVGLLLARVAAHAQPVPPTKDVVDVIILLDSSPSIASTDPNNARIEAARLLVEYLDAVGQITGVTARFSAANFGGQVKEDTAVPFSPVWDELAINAIRPDRISYTDFRPALRYALDQFQQRRGLDGFDPRARAVFIFTDGSPALTDEEMSLDEKRKYFRGEPIAGDPRPDLRMDQLLAELQGMNASVHVVSLMHQDRQLWIEALGSPDQYHSLGQDQAAVADLAAVFIRIASRLVGFDLDEALLVDAGETHEIVLLPYLEYAVFAVLKDEQDIETTIADPQGETGYSPPMSGRQNDLFSVYVVSAPLSGSWTVKAENGGARVWTFYRLPRIEFGESAVKQAAGTETTLSVRVRRGPDVVIDPNLALRAVVDPPYGKEFETVAATPDENGTYRVELGTLNEIGVYSVALSGTLGELPMAFREANLSIEVVPLPEITKVMVTSGEAGETIVMAYVSFADRLTPDQAIPVRVLDGAGKQVAVLSLLDDGAHGDHRARDGWFGGAIEADKMPATGSLLAGLKGVSTDGLTVNSKYSLELKPPVSVATPTPEKATSSPEATPTQSPSGKQGGPGSPKPPKVPFKEILILVVVVIILIATVGWFLRSRRPQAKVLDDETKNVVVSLLRVEWRIRRQKLQERFRGLESWPFIGVKFRNYREGTDRDFSEFVHGLESNALTDDVVPDAKKWRNVFRFARRKEKLEDWWWHLQEVMMRGKSVKLRSIATEEFEECAKRNVFSSAPELWAEAGIKGLLQEYQKIWRP